MGYELIFSLGTNVAIKFKNIQDVSACCLIINGIEFWFNNYGDPYVSIFKYFRGRYPILMSQINEPSDFESS